MATTFKQSPLSGLPQSTNTIIGSSPNRHNHKTNKRDVYQSVIHSPTAAPAMTSYVPKTSSLPSQTLTNPRSTPVGATSQVIPSYSHVPTTHGHMTYGGNYQSPVANSAIISSTTGYNTLSNKEIESLPVSNRGMLSEYSPESLNVRASRVPGVVPTHVHTTYFDSHGRVAAKQPVQTHVGSYRTTAIPKRAMVEVDDIDAVHGGSKVIYYDEGHYPIYRPKARRRQTRKVQQSSCC